MTTNLSVDRPREEAFARGRAQLSQFRQTWGGEAGTRYFLAGLTMQQAGMIHGLSGDALKRRVAELGLPASVLPPESKQSAEERYTQSLGPNLGKAAAAMERENPAICGK